MLDKLIETNPALLIPILAVTGTTLVFTVWILMHNWRKARQTEIEANLKKDMLARDFSAADIERVLLASTSRADLEPVNQETISDNEYYLIEKMLDAGYPTEEIARLVKAFKSGEKVTLDERVTA